MVGVLQSKEQVMVFTITAGMARTENKVRERGERSSRGIEGTREIKPSRETVQVTGEN